MCESSSKSVNTRVSLGFNFDIVIVQLNLTNVDAEEKSKLSIDIKFNNNNIKVTPSRINVSEFIPGRSFEFNELPAILKNALYKNPLECHVYYNNQPSGVCTFYWPKPFINYIAEGNGRELIHCDKADIYMEDKKVGRMEIISRLQIKCQEFDEMQILQPKFNPAHKVIKSNDVMFVVGENKNEPISCSDVDLITDSESINATCLDLSDFRHIHGKTVPNTAILESIETKCCKMKKSSNQCEQMIKNLLDKAKESPTLSENNTEQQPYVSQEQPICCTSDNRIASASSTDSYPPFCCISDEHVSNGISTNCERHGVKEKPAKRYCPLCHDNITWLPKFAACPKCGFRPILYNNEEKSYDHTLTASKILQDYNINGNVIKRASDLLMKTGPSRCTCKSGKICAHCRIKKLCQDIFQPAQKIEGFSGECEINSSDLYSRDCRPYLKKVFQELKEIFDMNEKKSSLVATDLNKVLTTNCECINFSNSAVNQPQRSNRNRKEVQKLYQDHEKHLDMQRKKPLLKNFKELEPCKNKILNCDKIRKCPGINIGHKTCFNGLTIVPRNMGWLWNTDYETNGLRTGWMPGAIRKPIKNLMQHFLNKNKIYSSCDWQRNGSCYKDQDEEEDFTKEPTLHIRKKNGVYYVTLRPTEGMGILKECTERCSNMKPIQFKIVKNPLLIELRKVKQLLKEMGFAKCICHKPISCCCCRTMFEKKKLEYQCSIECNERQLPNCADSLILSDTTDRRNLILASLHRLAFRELMCALLREKRLVRLPSMKQMIGK